MFHQAAGLFSLFTSSAVFRSRAVPTGCSGGLRPCVRRGAEGRHAPRWGGRTGVAGTVLLPQEWAVQTAWRSGRHTAATHNQTRAHTQTTWIRSERTRTEGSDETKRKQTGRKRIGQERRGLLSEGTVRIVGEAVHPVETHEEERDTNDEIGEQKSE